MILQPKRKTVLLVAGIAVSVIFIAKGSSIYSALFLGNSDEDFKYLLESSNIFIYIPFMIVVGAWAVATLYYYIINSRRFNRWWHWLVMLMFCTTSLSTLLNHFVCHKIHNIEPHFTEIYTDYIVRFSIWNTLISALLFVVVSFSIRWWSANCSKTPCPK